MYSSINLWISHQEIRAHRGVYLCEIHFRNIRRDHFDWCRKATRLRRSRWVNTRIKERGWHDQGCYKGRVITHSEEMEGKRGEVINLQTHYLHSRHFQGCHWTWIPGACLLRLVYYRQHISIQLLRVSILQPRLPLEYASNCTDCYCRHRRKHCGIF